MGGTASKLTAIPIFGNIINTVPGASEVFEKLEEIPFIGDLLGVAGLGGEGGGFLGGIGDLFSSFVKFIDIIVDILGYFLETVKTLAAIITVLDEFIISIFKGIKLFFTLVFENGKMVADVVAKFAPVFVSFIDVLISIIKDNAYLPEVMFMMVPIAGLVYGLTQIINAI